MTAKVTLSATIPVAQYANLQPSFEVEGDTVDAAMSTALETMKRVWDSVADKPLQLRDEPTAQASPGVPLVCWASGTVVNFDPIQHVYSPGKWLSGSAFAGQFKGSFPAELIAGKMAAKSGVEVGQILDMWSKNAEASSLVGSSVHAALELYGKYLSTSEAVKGTDESALTKNLILRPIVQAFFAEHAAERAEYEVFVADPTLKHCGQIDRLVIEDNGIFVEDFKTNTDLTKKETIGAPFKGVVPNTTLGAYWLQLSFYANILQTHGQVVKGLRVHHWTGTEWATFEHDVVDISEAIK
ncbi:PD-(D/E)XK nuclease family protein [Rhodococcoides fascians]|uniref:PD-(D/E)XK nuclease family protein n=1 Tax=Rhodococcoides fascians TaxID=1828 RepID=UPI0009B8BEE2|nr:PD-(D/E)XK nuclease family protein [Rhodococcus fascians]